jgi:predicted Holliday junction resolvase-like endonuclease
VRSNVWEGMAPYLPEFPYNLRDCEHLRKPVDFVAFDGLSEGGEVAIHFLEIKTGRSGLNPNKRRVRAAIHAGWAKPTLGQVVDLGSSLPLAAVLRSS